MKNKTIILAFLIILSATIANAASVSSLSGTFSHGQALTISGSGFGTGDTALMLWDDFESGTLGQTISSSPLTGSWTVTQDGPWSEAPTYSSTQEHSGSQSCKGHTSAEYSNLVASFSNPGTYLYGSFWLRWTWSGSGGEGQVKVNQVWGTCRGTCPGQTCGDYNPGVMVGSSGGSWGGYIVTETSYGGTCYQEDYMSEISQSNWHFYEFFGKQSDIATANGTVKIYVDGVLQMNWSNVATRTLSGNYWNEFAYLAGITNFGGSWTSYIDDVYLNNSWQHVLIGNNVTYTSCTKRDIQPVNWSDPAWSDSSINVKVNTGDYANGTTVYLHIIDSNGSALDLNGASTGQGYPIVIGQDYGEAPPPDPTLTIPGGVTISGGRVE